MSVEAVPPAAEGKRRKIDDEDDELMAEAPALPGAGRQNRAQPLAQCQEDFSPELLRLCAAPPKKRPPPSRV